MGATEDSRRAGNSLVGEGQERRLPGQVGRQEAESMGMGTQLGMGLRTELRSGQGGIEADLGPGPWGEAV